ncbi:ribonucleases P/MRP protein subunit POP1 isoform X1 [Tribolium madens]|uniref:ribonucleases P/MRP protein subunit POP1 isoform X1 n=1 Tax=Tribolium madens TaxID=41895 RepID=UPI001CF724B3|nr:ribonucleases P/MRP protein subunit POP1 isoform X1 [Tribolium madens]
MIDEEAQYDALLGGSEELPSNISLSKFVACRSQEIQMMKNSLLSQSGSKLAFQTLPKHMRRRAMSHNVKRLPRRLRQIHLNQMKKSGMPNQQKRPSRKYRRKPRNLLEEYTKRANKKYKWLQTHIWHAKRFHMVEKWGYKLPYHACDKAFRACYRAMTQHCLLQDISYYSCLEIHGDKIEIIEKIKLLCKPDGGLSIGAKAFAEGNREGEITLFEIGGSSQKAIGKVTFQWQPSTDEKCKLWLWVHAAYYCTTKNTLVECFKNTEIEIHELRLELSRFRLTGPLSNPVLQDALALIDIFDIKLVPESPLKKYVDSPENKAVIINQCEFWKKLDSVSSLHEISPHLVLPLIVKDPRLNLPKKRMKSVLTFGKLEFDDIPVNISGNPLWDKNIRKYSNENKVSDSKIVDLQSGLLVPGSDLKGTVAHIPIILIQRPGNKLHNVGLGSGWDVILPTAWAKPFWIAFVMRGARVGGLRESNSMLYEMGKSQLLHPDTEAGVDEELRHSNQNKVTFFKKPPNKRINYSRFKIASPFACNWKLLCKDWSSSFTGEFSVIRDKRLLHSINSFLDSKTQPLPEYPKSCLIPVKVECEKRGSLAEYAIICVPKCQSDLTKGLVEPNCEDINKEKRKELRRAHHSLLKKLRKKRKLNPELTLPDDHSEILRSYTEKMRALWLPDATTIRYSCSREVVGFVSKGGFSFSIGKSAGTGYIISDSLPELINFRNRVLLRNTNSRQYKTATLRVIVE